ncbi:manganese efflux pump [Candidatus Peregrinibacteria bacterium]|nr:manganese efflux pump [Candidatus Peregrinibacteria bacterium]MBT7737006.1 manganese efflux pump [Candidatus Peregrinibacteria bacterium]
MELLNTVLIAIALAMDSFTVSISGGSSMKKIKLKDSITIGLYFGFFQFFMTVLGWKSGIVFSEIIDSFDHWIALGLLVFIGGKMIFNSFKKTECTKFSFTHKTLFILAIATSIDALGIGLSYALLDKSVIFTSTIIGIVAFTFSAGGIYLGKLCKKALKNKAELIGGILLILIGLKIAYEHGVFNF